MNSTKILGPLGAALCSLALLGCPNGEQGAAKGEAAAPAAEAPKPGAATPEEVYTEAKKAVTAGDWKAFYGLILPSTRDKALGGMVFGASMMAAFSDDKSWKPQVDELMKKHAIGEPPKDSKPENLEADMAKIVSGVADKPGCFGDFMSWMQAHSKDGKKLELGTLEKVTITGDTARGTEVTPKADGTKSERPMVFQRVDGRWFMDITAKK